MTHTARTDIQNVLISAKLCAISFIVRVVVTSPDRGSNFFVIGAHNFFKFQKKRGFFRYFSRIMKIIAINYESWLSWIRQWLQHRSPPFFRFSLWDQAWNAYTLYQKVVSLLQLPSEISLLHLPFWLMEPPYIYVHSETTKSHFYFYVWTRTWIATNVKTHFFWFLFFTCVNVMLNRSSE